MKRTCDSCRIGATVCSLQQPDQTKQDGLLHLLIAHQLTQQLQGWGEVGEEAGLHCKTLGARNTEILISSAGFLGSLCAAVLCN